MSSSGVHIGALSSRAGPFVDDLSFWILDPHRDSDIIDVSLDESLPLGRLLAKRAESTKKLAQRGLYSGAMYSTFASPIISSDKYDSSMCFI